MTVPIQKTGFRDSQYERPNQKWVCGWAAEGTPCLMGPDRRGGCTAREQSRCTPHREGDRYFCGRPAVHGGPCELGPLPDGACCAPEPSQPVCQPRLSIRARRARLVLACVTLALGLLILSFAGPWGLSLVSPGDLTTAHGAVGGSGEAPGGHCAACHTAATGGPATWLRRAFAPVNGPGESTKCLACHFEGQDPAGAEALLVHGIDPERLAERTVEPAGATGSSTPLQALVALSGAPPLGPGREIACATCHREHRGADHDLSFMINDRCQACHQVRFSGFGNGHPEFAADSVQHGGIRFDHATHAVTHFGKTEFDCARCHAPAGNRKEMVLKPFADACSGCHYQGKPDHHGGRIRAGGSNLIQLPVIDLAGAAVYWPGDAARGEEISPLMRLLLAGDDEALAPMASMVEQEAEWIPEYWEPDEEELRIALLTAIKRLVHEFAAGDEAALGDRIARALDADRGSPEVAAFAEQLAAARFAMLAYQSRWLPRLGDDVAGRKGLPAAARTGPAWDVSNGASGWYVDTETASVAYRTISHADPFLRIWIDAMAKHAGVTGNGEIDEAAALRGELRTQLFDELTSSEHGAFLYASCIRCHNVETQDGQARVAWKAQMTAGHGSGYARFDHRPHVSRGAESLVCGSCHLVEEKPVDGGATPARGLIAHTKAQCTGCHVEGRAGDDCLTCHQYHFQRP